MGKSKTNGKKRATHKVTICEVLRLINDKCQQDSKVDKAIRGLLTTAIDMAKRMNARLDFYAHHYHEGIGWDYDMWKKNIKVHEKRMLRGKSGYRTD
ncbi:MAG: hypothetical protein GY853_13735 [PVC group bacterium]|nr:hypothetical protein [PVC group bacterium]